MVSADRTSELPAGLAAGPEAASPDAGSPDAGSPDAGSPDAAGLAFVGEMYGVQLDQLAMALDIVPRRVATLAARWRTAGQAEIARLSPGDRWVWLTKRGLADCGLRYAPVTPGLARLAHLRAVTAVRLALAGTRQYADAQAYWRSERRLRARIGGRIGLREHVPDGELHWPDNSVVPWAGECWAIEAELTPKTLARTTAVMREVLARTGDYGCPAADVRVPGQPARHARAVYVCSAAALPVVARARDALGSLGARIEIRNLPPEAEFAPRQPPPRQPASRASGRLYRPGESAP